jgi:RNA polymerase sigma-70 factor, ECF subfamily
VSMDAQDTLREMLAEGHQKWPSIRVTLEDYQRHCERICGDARPVEELRMHAADIYLCCACAHRDPVALGVFEREAAEVVRGAIARVHREREFVRETQQEFWKKLLAGPDAKVNDYCGRGPLQAWLRIAAARLALDRHRAERLVAGRETDLGDCLAEQAFGPESTLTRARFHVPFREALRHAIAGLTHKDRNLLRMHVVGRCSIDQIGRAYNVHRATAARWLEQAREHILQDIRAKLEIAGPHLTDSEFQSVARVVGGELGLEVSLFSSEVPLQHATSDALESG